MPAKTSLSECSGCGGARNAINLPRRVMPMRSPPLARLTSSENLRRTSVIVILIMSSEYHRSNRSVQSRAAEFGDHGFAPLQDDGVNAIED